MKRILTFLFVLGFLAEASAQQLYVKTYGDSLASPMMFLHGGPGYNSASFEGTTAEALASAGFYVVVYDRRGEGRSVDFNAKFTFDETIQDISKISDSLHLDSIILLGHSFGGMVAVEFATAYPEKTKAVVLIGAPVSLQESFKTILKASRKIYEKNEDKVNLQYIQLLESMDSTSLMYSSYSFMHAMQNDFYSPDSLTSEAKSLYEKLQSDEQLSKYATKMDQKAPSGFWKNDNYTTIDLTEDLTKLKESGTSLYGIYGQDDGLYSSEQIEHLMSIIGSTNVKYISNCSHSVFIDQQNIFIDYLEKWFK